MPSISSSPQEEVGQSHLSRHTGLGSEVRGEPSAADARRCSTHGRPATTPSVTSTATTRSQPHVVPSSPRTSQLPGFGATVRDFAAQSVPHYGLDPRMPSSASSRNATTHDTAFMTPAPLDWSVSGNSPIGTASGAPPPSYSFDGSTATRVQSSVPMAFERDSSIFSPSSLGTSASATSSTTASANPSIGVASSAPPRSFDDSTATRMQSSVPMASEHDRSILSPSSLGTPAPANPSTGAALSAPPLSFDRTQVAYPRGHSTASPSSLGATASATPSVQRTAHPTNETFSSLVASKLREGYTLSSTSCPETNVLLVRHPCGLLLSVVTDKWYILEGDQLTELPRAATLALSSALSPSPLGNTASATTTDGSTATRMQSSAPMAPERGRSISSPSSLGTPASAKPSMGAASGAPPPSYSYSFDGSTATRVQSSVPTAFERDSSISSPSSLGATASANPSNAAHLATLQDEFVTDTVQAINAARALSHPRSSPDRRADRWPAGRCEVTPRQTEAIRGLIVDSSLEVPAVARLFIMFITTDVALDTILHYGPPL